MSDTTHRITGIAMGTVYVDDYDAAFAFYHDLLGLEKQFDTGPKACYFRITDEVGIYLEGGNSPAAVTTTSVRAAFVLSVESAFALHAHLLAAGVRCMQATPMDMGGGLHWFQFYDPAGNILEALGGR